MTFEGRHVRLTRRRARALHRRVEAGEAVSFGGIAVTPVSPVECEVAASGVVRRVYRADVLDALRPLV